MHKTTSNIKNIKTKECVFSIVWITQSYKVTFKTGAKPRNCAIADDDVMCFGYISGHQRLSKTKWRWMTVLITSPYCGCRVEVRWRAKRLMHPFNSVCVCVLDRERHMHGNMTLGGLSKASCVNVSMWVISFFCICFYYYFSLKPTSGAETWSQHKVCLKS